MMNTMKMLKLFILLMACGCGGPSEPDPIASKFKSKHELSAANTSSADDSHDWSKQLGETVTLTGKALNFKIGAALHLEDSLIYVDLDYWPDGLYHGGDDGEIVRVTGTVARRNMLPVFVPDPDDDVVQGIAVPEGTDLDQAAMAYVLENVEWERVESNWPEFD